MERFDVPARLFVASALCGLVASGATVPWAKTLGALPLVLYFPGRCLLAAAFPQARPGGEIQALAIALSLAIVTLLGVGLDACHVLGPTAWLKSLLVVCTLCCMASGIGLARTDRPLEPRRARVPLRLTHLTALAIALGLAGWAYGDASRGALSQHSDLYTNFWMVPVGVPTPSVAVVGVKNQEGRVTTFAIDLVGRGVLLDRLPSFALQPGEERTFQVALPSIAFANPSASDVTTPAASDPASVAKAKDRALADSRIETRLYKDRDRSTVYRRAWVALPARRTQSSEVGQVADAGPAGDLAFRGDLADTLRSVVVPNGASPVSAATPAPAMPLAQAASRRDPTVATEDTGTQTVPDAGVTNIASEMAAALTDVSQSFRSPAFSPQSLPARPSPDTPLN